MRGGRTFPVIPLLTGLMLLAWPFLIGFGLTHNSLQWLLPLMALVLLLRLRQARRNAGPMRYVVQCVALAGIALCAASYLLKTHQWLLFYPVVVNLVMLAVFGGSLWTAMPLVERLARLRECPNCPERALYPQGDPRLVRLFHRKRRDGAVHRAPRRHASVDAVERMVAYILMGTLMATEWLVRQRVIKKEMHND